MSYQKSFSSLKRLIRRRLDERNKELDEAISTVLSAGFGGVWMNIAILGFSAKPSLKRLIRRRLDELFGLIILCLLYCLKRLIRRRLDELVQSTTARTNSVLSAGFGGVWMNDLFNYIAKQFKS